MRHAGMFSGMARQRPGWYRDAHLLREGSKKLGPALAGWVAGERFGVGLVALGADRSGIKLWVLR